MQWKLTQANYGPIRIWPAAASAGFAARWYLQGKVNQEVRGVPYCWGCHGSLANFRQRIEARTPRPATCARVTRRGPTSPAWIVPLLSARRGGCRCTTRPPPFPRSPSPWENPWDLRPGDALNKPGSHVMLFLRFTPDRKAEVMEPRPAAATDASAAMSIRWLPAAARLCSGRFRGLAHGRDDCFGKRLSGGRALARPQTARKR